MLFINISGVYLVYFKTRQYRDIWFPAIRWAYIDLIHMLCYIIWIKRKEQTRKGKRCHLLVKWTRVCLINVIKFTSKSFPVFHIIIFHIPYRRKLLKSLGSTAFNSHAVLNVVYWLGQWISKEYRYRLFIGHFKQFTPMAINSMLLQNRRHVTHYT